MAGNPGRGRGRGQPLPPQQLHIVPQDLQDLIAGVGAAAANATRHTDWGKLIKEFAEILKSDSCKPSSDFTTNGSTRIYRDRLTTAFKLREDLAFLLQPDTATYEVQRDLISPPISATNENALQLEFYNFLKLTFTAQPHSIRNIDHIFRHTEAEVHQTQYIGTTTWNQIHQSLTEHEQPFDRETKIRNLEEKRRQLIEKPTYTTYGHVSAMDLLRLIMDTDLDLHKLQQPSQYSTLIRTFVVNMRSYQSILAENPHIFPEKCSTQRAAAFVTAVANTQIPEQGNIAANWNAYYTSILAHWKVFKAENDQYLQTLSAITGSSSTQ